MAAAANWVKINRHTIVQTGLMTSLLDGVYEGETTISQLLAQGNFGIGTFNSLDGEMVIMNGECFQLRSDGKVARPGYEMQTPYAVVTNFVPHLKQKLPLNKTRVEISDFIDAMTYSPNYMYALRITGKFHWVTTRTVSKQQKPYPPMAQAVQDDRLYKLTDVQGTMVGFRTPVYEQGISVPGCHVHFLDETQKQGGHVIDFVVAEGEMELCLGTDLRLELPLTKVFKEANLNPENLTEQIKIVEKSS